MAGRKRHSAEEIVRKLRRADELTAAGASGEEVAADLGISAATLYNWRADRNRQRRQVSASAVPSRRSPAE